MNNDTRHSMRIADTLAVVALVLATVASIVGILVPGLYRDTAEMVREARAADLVTLFLAVPALGLGLWCSRSGSVTGRLIAVGALGYLAYSYAIYSFSVVINPMTPIHIAILALASWGLVLSAFGLDGATLDRATLMPIPRRTTGGFLLLVAAMFGLMWLGQIGSVITSGTLPTAISDLNLPTNPIYTLDLAFALPSLTLAGIWLIRFDRRGPAATMAALAFSVLMGSSVLGIFAVAAAGGVEVEVVPVVIFVAVTGIAASLALIASRSTHRATVLRPLPVVIG